MFMLHALAAVKEMSEAPAAQAQQLYKGEPSCIPLQVEAVFSRTEQCFLALVQSASCSRGLSLPRSFHTEAGW